MSAESGVPTFRDAQSGLWAKFRPEELATEEAFRARPQMVWDWYALRREMIAKVEPNAGHRAVAAFQQRHPGRLTVVTADGKTMQMKAGDPIVEVVDTWHHGKNEGTETAEIIVFYAGTPGQALSIKQDH